MRRVSLNFDFAEFCCSISKFFPKKSRFSRIFCYFVLTDHFVRDSGACFCLAEVFENE